MRVVGWGVVFWEDCIDLASQTSFQLAQQVVWKQRGLHDAASQKEADLTGHRQSWLDGNNINNGVGCAVQAAKLLR